MSDKATWLSSEGLWGMRFSEPWPHLTLLSQKKKKVWGSECRLADSGRELYNPQIAGLVKNRNSDKKANNKVVDSWRLINAMSPLLQRQIKNKYLNLNLNALGCC